MAGIPETKKALIVVRTYPAPARRGVEVSCTAAITEHNEWLRLFPVPWRYLDREKQFRKYQWVEVSVNKATDPRPESYKLIEDSINIVSDILPTAHEWDARKRIVFPLLAPSLCHLQRERDKHKFPTLGIFRPRVIERLIITPESPTWNTAQLAILRQQHLFLKPIEELEKVPYKFQYQFRCDDDSCKGHTLMCTDWEIGESWRKWSKQYGNDWEGFFRQRYEKEMIEKFDTHFYAGTVHQHPSAWIIVGLFYPPKPTNLSLFG
ncbi:MAG: hypothetical protein AABN33_21955 [Acidobacteriota bacterium]